MIYGCDIHIKPEFLTNIQRYYDRDNYETIQCNSKDWDFKKKNYRIIHIDGDHTAEMAYVDIENAYTHLNPGGIVIVDDMFHPQFPGVTEAVCEAIKDLKLLPIIGGGNKIWLTNDEEFHIIYFNAMREFLPQWGKTKYYGHSFVGCQFSEWRER